MLQKQEGGVKGGDHVEGLNGCSNDRNARGAKRMMGRKGVLEGGSEDVDDLRDSGKSISEKERTRQW